MGGYSGYCSASLCQRDYNNRYYFYYLRPVMIFWVQLCCKSRDGKYWKITVIEDYRAQCNFEWLQHCFYATFENHGPTKGCGIPALHLEWEKSIHQSSSKMSWTEYSCCYLQIPKEFKEDWKMTIKWWQFSLDQWGISITSYVCVCTFCGQKVGIWSSKSTCQLALFIDSSFPFACTPAPTCLIIK